MRKGKRRYLVFGLVLAYVLFLCALFAVARLPGYVIPAFALLSLFSYLAYRKDKRAAERRQWRTPEEFLHALSLLGGWPGALIAQNRLRHKSAKTSFRIVFYITVLLNVVATGYVGLRGDGVLRSALLRVLGID